MTFLLSSTENRNHITLPAKHVYPFAASGKVNDASKQVRYDIISFSLRMSLDPWKPHFHLLGQCAAAIGATYMMRATGGAQP